LIKVNFPQKILEFTERRLHIWKQHKKLHMNISKVQLMSFGQ